MFHYLLHQIRDNYLVQWQKFQFIFLLECDISWKYIKNAPPVIPFDEISHDGFTELRISIAICSSDDCISLSWLLLLKKKIQRGGEFDCWGCEKEKYDNIYFPKTLWGDKKIVETRKVLLVKDLTCNDPFFPKNSAHNTWRLIQSWKGKWMLTSTHLWSSKMDFFHDDNFLVFPLFRLLL